MGFFAAIGYICIHTLALIHIILLKRGRIKTNTYFSCSITHSSSRKNQITGYDHLYEREYATLAAIDRPLASMSFTIII